MSLAPSDSARLDQPAGIIRRLYRSNTFWLCLMFVAGVAVGAAGAVLEIDRIRREFHQHPERIVERMTAFIKCEAGLNDEETKTIRAIVERHHERMMAIHPLMTREFDTFEKEVSGAMTQQQRDRWLPRFKTVRERMFP